MIDTVVGLFDDARAARDAVDELIASGVRGESIGVIAHDPRRGDEASRLPDRASEIVAGAGIGGALGGIAGLLAGIVALPIPGVGPVITAGAIAAALTGVGVGAGVGSVVGALSHHGVPHAEAHRYADALRRGATLVTVTTDDSNADVVRRIVARHAPADIEEHVERGREAGWPPFDLEAPGVSPADMDRPLARTFEMYRDDFRRDWSRRFAHSGLDYARYEPAYRFGFERALHPPYGDLDWSAIEATARDEWEAAHPGTWSTFADAIRYGWDRVRDEDAAA